MHKRCCKIRLCFVSVFIIGINILATKALAGNGVLPIITSITPNIGSTMGGTSIVIRGVYLENISSVTFDGVPALNVTINNANTITAVTPIHEQGAVNVEIITQDGSNTLQGLIPIFYYKKPKNTLPATKAPKPIVNQSAQSIK